MKSQPCIAIPPSLSYPAAGNLKQSFLHHLATDFLQKALFYTFPFFSVICFRDLCMSVCEDLPHLPMFALYRSSILTDPYAAFNVFAITTYRGAMTHLRPVPFSTYVCLPAD